MMGAPGRDVVRTTLQLVEELDVKVDELREGQHNIQTMLSVQQERSLGHGKRLDRVEKVGVSLLTGLVIALVAFGLSGCGLFKSITAPAPVAPEPPRIDVVARAVANTVAIHEAEEDFRYCSGVAAEGTIITAAHCVPEGTKFKVLYQGEKYWGVVISRDEETDLAIVDAVGARLKDSIPLAEKAPTLGNKVVWLGYPLGRELLMSTGIVGNPYIKQGDIPFMVVSGQFIPGGSGGPVLNYKGELVGILLGTGTYMTSLVPLGYSVHFSTLKENL